MRIKDVIIHGVLCWSISKFSKLMWKTRPAVKKQLIDVRRMTSLQESRPPWFWIEWRKTKKQRGTSFKIFVTGQCSSSFPPATKDTTLQVVCSSRKCLHGWATRSISAWARAWSCCSSLVACFRRSRCSFWCGRRSSSSTCRRIFSTS